MKQLTTIIVLIMTLLVVNLATDNNPTQVNAATEAPIPAPQLSLPGTSCCGEDCDCCDACPCNTKPVVKSQSPKVSQPSRKLGDIQYFNGVKNTLVKITDKVGGGWNYHYRPVLVTSQPSPATVTSYTPRWANYDGLSRIQHAQTYHGLNPSTMSTSQLYRQMDADHDRYGAGHSQILQSRQSQPVVFSNSGNCPGGVCPTPTRRRLFR